MRGNILIKTINKKSSKCENGAYRMIRDKWNLNLFIYVSVVKHVVFEMVKENKLKRKGKIQLIEVKV